MQKNFNKREEEFAQRVVDIARVTRVMAGGKRMKFRACLAIGDKNGRVAIGLAKGADVTMAISKAFLKAKKNLIKVPIVDGTIPHEIYTKFKSAKILLKPAKKGTGIKVGGALRIVCELAGIDNVRGKILGCPSKINNVKAAIIALDSFKKSKKNKKESQVTEKNTPKEQDKKESSQDVQDKKEVKSKIGDRLKKIIKKDK